MIREVAAQHQRALNPVGFQLHRRIGGGPVSPAARSFDPIRKANLFARKAAIQVWFGKSLKRLSSYDITGVHPDNLTSRHSPKSLMCWINVAIPVIPTDDGDNVRDRFEDMIGQIFGPLLIGDVLAGDQKDGLLLDQHSSGGFEH